MENSEWRRCRFDVKASFKSFEPIPEPFAPAQDDRHEDDMHVVDQIGLEELPNSADAATDPDVEVTGQGAGLLERGDGVGVNEMEGRSALHLEYRPRIAGAFVVHTPTRAAGRMHWTQLVVG